MQQKRELHLEEKMALLELAWRILLARTHRNYCVGATVLWFFFLIPFTVYPGDMRFYGMSISIVLGCLLATIHVYKTHHKRNEGAYSLFQELWRQHANLHDPRPKNILGFGGTYRIRLMNNPDKDYPDFNLDGGSNGILVITWDGANSILVEHQRAPSALITYDGSVRDTADIHR